MSTAQTQYAEASLKTADNLRSIAQSQMMRDLSALTLPEIEATVDLVSKVVPAGNVPGVILNGLGRLLGRKPPPQTVKRDVNLLFKGVDQALDKAVYGAFFAGPAAVIWGYQNLLKLAGKDPEDSFPEGTWQFYVDYALREDTARHANETHGFDTRLKQHHISLDKVDRITAWVMAAIHALHEYQDMLANEWRERVYTRLLEELTQAESGASAYATLYRRWEKQRPYARGSDAQPGESYPAYRRRKFEAFLAEASGDLPDHGRRQWRKQIETVEEAELPAYQQQMSILAYLEPGSYGETRTPIPLKQAHVGLIHQGCYYLIPACAPGSAKPADPATVRALIATLIAYPANSRPAQLSALARIKRNALPGLRQKFKPELVKELDMLRYAPILLNCDPRPRHLPLAELRQAERGGGDQPLTLFDTGETVVFDQSHIFFDGAWGAALAEIMTNEAISWAVYLKTLPPAQPRQTRPYALTFQFGATETALIQKAAGVTPEVSAETDKVDLKAIVSLRRLFKRRNDLIELTINDILVLYRAIHAVTYEPDPNLVTQLKNLSRLGATRAAATAALEALYPAKAVSPSIVIPVDASRRAPRDRLYPMTFEVPLYDLDLLNLHRRVVAALAAYQRAGGDRAALYAEFDRLQRTYLATLASFGLILSKAKQIALAGASASVGSIKLLAHIPAPLQRMLDQIPSRFDLLNDLIRGREVLSNVGAVAPTSTLTRFITAKDDNDKKMLGWGIMTDAEGVMRITLRDFRPHVALLISSGYQDLAAQLAQDYLDAYAKGLNTFVRDLRQITQTSRETQLVKLEQGDAS